MTVVGVTHSGDEDAFERCVRSILAHTSPEVRVIVTGGGAGAESDPRVEALAGAPAEIAAAAAPADLVLLDGAHLVGPGWLEGLRDAAHSDTTVATASALTTAGGPTGPAEPFATTDDAARAVREHAARLRPRIERPASACVYVRRAALELAGPLDDGFAARCSSHGLLHVAADEVIVVPAAEMPVTSPPPAEPPEHRDVRLAAQRPLDRALARARRAIDGLSVTIDGRAITEVMAGTQVHALELIAALHRTAAVRIRVVLPPDVGAHAREVLESLDGVEQLAASEITSGVRRSTIVHRPYQVSEPSDLLALRLLGERLVVTHQDLLNFHNPGYHPDRDSWHAHRLVTRSALAAADAVVSFSEHAAADLRSEDLVPDWRHRTIPIGVDHAVSPLVPEPRPPAGAEEWGERPLLACLGTDLRHKNRLFALSMLETLRERHGWDGILVLAGGHVANGSSAEDERDFLERRPELAAAVVRLPAVDEAAKAWLYERAAAVLYPTTYEGFGLIPFEAAGAGTPCLCAPQASLAELLPPELTLLVPWNVEESADRAIAILRDPARADALVEGVLKAGASLTWDRTAAALVELYDEVLTLPARERAALAWTALETEEHRRSLKERYDEIGPTGHALVGAGHLLPEDAQRALAGLARRGATRRPLLAALSLLHRLGGRGRDPR